MKRRARVENASGPARQPANASSYDVVALVASAGGRGAIATLLQKLPKDFPVPIVVMLHLGHDEEEPLRPHARHLPFRVDWAEPGIALSTGRVLVAPPRSFMEVLPDGTCQLARCERGALDKPMDRLLRSIARSFAHRAVAVVLSGMLDDGAEGAYELHSAGGAVIAQREAEYPSMPLSAIRSGGADVSLPVEQIADLLRDLAAGATLPRPPSELDAVAALFAGPGRARAAMRAVDWQATPLGPVRDWSPALCTTVRNQMCSSFATCIFWGPELVQIYNEAYLPVLGGKLGAAGKPARLTWPELWSTMGQQLEAVLECGIAVYAEDRLVQTERHGFVEEAYLSYSYSPLHDRDGTVRGVLSTSAETTGRVRASRRLETLRAIAVVHACESPLLVAESTAKVLADAPLDVPFALFYLLDRGRRRAHLAGAVGLNAGTAAAPQEMVLSDAQAVWPLAEVAREGSPCTVNDLAQRFPGFHAGPWPEPPSSAMLLPLSRGADGPLAGVLILGLSPRLRFDASYEPFLRVIAQQVSSAIGEAESRRQQRERSDRLAELDRAKVEFFSNVSHEFRTPLTLLLGPLEEILARRPSLPPDLDAPIATATRNGRRLLALVNSLLDFSVAESHRQQARLEPTDLAALTTDVASAFRSAIEAGNLSFEVRCEPNLPLVAVDPEMWEKIVSNLVSNAFKFTFEGTITVELRALALHAELVIKDTGVGIPASEMPNLFKRFHRIRGSRARTSQGSGIGLWMVDDLVKRMGGMLRATSKENAGTAFTVWIPYQSKRSTLEASADDAGPRSAGFARQVAEEAARWRVDSDAQGDALNDVFGPPQPPALTGVVEQRRGSVLVVDDNADMREYLERLLSPRWRVESAADGASGFRAAVERRPDVILSDVMMPGADGFEFLKQIRQHDELRHVPVVLLTARAGEEAAIEGLVAGADDYIAKPFSPRELVARVAAAADRARAESALRKSEAELIARNDELERFNRVTVGRELRMVELKQRVRALEQRLGETPAGRDASAADEATVLSGLPAPAHSLDDADVGRAGTNARDARLATLNVLADAVEARDLAERLNVELREREAWLRGQREALASAVNLAPIEASLGILVRTATEAMGPNSRAAFYLADAEGTTLHHIVGMSEEYARAVDGFQIGPESLACGLAAHTGKAILTSDVQSDPRWEPWRWLAEDFDYRGCWSFPIRTAAGKYVGSLAIYSQAPREATARDEELASLLIHTAAIIFSWHTEAAERKRAEEALRESELRSRLLVEGIAQAIWESDSSGKGVGDSPSWRAGTGQTLEEWLGRGWVTAIHPDDRDFAERKWREAVATRHNFDAECRLRSASGGHRWANVRAVPLLSDDGEIQKWLGMTIDIDARKRAELA